MRSIIVAVLVIKLVNSAFVSFSENDKLQNVQQDRINPENYDKYVGNPKGARKTSLFSRREIYSDIQKKRCDSCREMKRCKVQGKCELCTRVCRSLETTTSMPPSEEPVLGNIQAYSEPSEQPATEASQKAILFEKSGRYYTIGAFGPGPKQSLIARLLNITKTDNLDKFVVLAKAKGKAKDSNPKRPIIIDTANIFKINGNNKELNAEIYPVKANPDRADLDLTSQIEHELNLAVQQKKKFLGDSHLTQEEVDKVIDHALTLFTRKIFSPTSKLAKNLVQLQSRSNAIDTPHITTKRSIPFWKTVKSHEKIINNDDADKIVGSQQSLNQNPKLQNALLPQTNETSTDNENLTEKYNTLESRIQNTYQPLSTNSLIKNTKDMALGSIGMRSSHSKNDYKTDPYLTEDECHEDDESAINETGYSEESAEDLVEYEPRPPKYTEERENTYQVLQQQAILNKSQYSSPLSHNIIPEIPLDESSPEIISIPIYNYDKPESADQHMEGAQYQKLNTIIPLKLSSYGTDIDSHDSAPTTIYKKSPENAGSQHQLDNNFNTEDDEDSSPLLQAVMDNSQNKIDASNSDTEVSRIDANENSTSEILYANTTDIRYFPNETIYYMNTDNSSEPIVGMSIPGNLSEEIEDGRRQSDVEFDEPPKFNENVTNDKATTDHQKESENYKDERFEVSENNLNSINASLFTLILKNLEKKVENIADLVKKTCGKKPEPERLYKDRLVKETPITPASKQNQFESTLGKQFESPETPDNTTNFETVATVSQTEASEEIPSKDNSSPALINVDAVVDELQKGHQLLLDKALGMADLIQESIEKPNPANNQVVSSPTDQNNIDLRPDNISRGLFENTDTTTAYSRRNENFESSPTENLLDENTQNSAERCKDDLEEYVGKSEAEKLQNANDAKSTELAPVQSRSSFKDKTTATTEQTDSQVEENVGCSKEDSDEYIGGKHIETNNTEAQSKLVTSTARSNDNFKESRRELSAENVACSKESDENDEYLRSQKTEETQSTSAPTTNNVEPKITESREINEDNNINTNLKQRIINENDSNCTSQEVGCSKEESEEHIGADNKETKLDMSPTDNKEAVGCSKEEEVEEYPIYSSSARNPSPNAESSLPSLNSVRYKPLIPAANDKILRSNKLLLRPSSKPKVHTLNSNTDPNISSEDSTDDNKGTLLTDSSVTPSLSIVHLQPQTTTSPPNAEEELHQPIKHKIPVPHYLSIEQKPPASSQANKLSSPPQTFEQRFGEEQESENIGEVGADGFHVHRPKNLPNWPQLPNNAPLVGAEAGNAQASTAAHTQNPYSIFGRVVPQLNNTEISFHHIPNNKVYFVGTGMQLPLNMKKHADGSYQLSVDVEKLCTTCTDELCKKKLDNQLSEEQNNEKTKVSTETENTESKGDLKQRDTSSEHQQQNRQSREEFHHLKPQKIEILSMEAPIFRNRRIPSPLRHHNITKYGGKPLLRDHHSNKAISNRSTNKMLNLAANERKYRPMKQKEKKHPSLLDLDTKHESKRSELSKRSANAHIILRPTKSHNYILKNSNFDSAEKPSLDSEEKMDLGNMDNSLNKIDKNMKSYFDRRQKLENHYRNRNKHDLEHPDDTKDIIKKRISLVNNLLTWMKSMAMEDAHST